MIDREFMLEKINLITRDLKRLEVFSDLSIDQIAKDFIKFAALKNILMETIGRAIDINQHLISELYGLKQKRQRLIVKHFYYLKI